MSTSEPLYVVKCPYCGAEIIVFKSNLQPICTVCGGKMEIRILKRGDAGFEEAVQTQAKLKNNYREFL